MPPVQTSNSLRVQGNAHSDQPAGTDGPASARTGLAPHRRVRATLGSAAQRLKRRQPTGNDRIWSPELISVALIGFALALIAIPFDGAVFRLVDGRWGWWPIAAMRDITNIGLSQWYIVPAALALIVIAQLDWGRRRHRGRARLYVLFGQSAFALVAVAAPGIVVNLVKIFIGRARPVLFAQYGPLYFDPFSTGYSMASMPSGHSVTMGSVAAILAIWFPRARWIVLSLGIFFAATRVATAAHYPSDVIAGYTFGLVGALVIARALALRGMVFRLHKGQLFPSVRHTSALRGSAAASQSV